MLSPPPRNAAGQVEPHDHQEILPDDGVIRRVSQEFVVPDKDGMPRVSTMAFQPSSVAQGGGLSIDLQREIEESGRDARQFVMSPPWIGSVRFSAGQLRGEELMVGYENLCLQTTLFMERYGETFRRGKKRGSCKLPNGSSRFPEFLSNKNYS